MHYFDLVRQRQETRAQEETRGDKGETRGDKGRQGETRGDKGRQDPREGGHTIQHQGGHLKKALRTPNSTLFGEKCRFQVTPRLVP